MFFDSTYISSPISTIWQSTKRRSGTFKKQKKIEEKKRITKILINSLKIPKEQTKLYLDALENLDEKKIDKMYEELTYFIQDIEIKELEDIKKSNYTNITGMQKKEAEKKQKEINAFSLLLNNI